MIKFIKLLLGLTILLALGAVVIVAGALLYFDPNEHKDFVITRVEKQTGRDFAITGNINLTYYPWLGLEADGVTLGNAAGFGDAPFFHADHVALRIKTLPLLKNQYELDTLKLHGLQLHLARNKNGATNWADLAQPPPPRKKKAPLQFTAVILGGVDVQDGRITWNDQATGQAVALSDIHLTTGQLTYGEPINLVLGLVAEASQPALRSDTMLTGVLNYDLDAELYSFKPIDLTAKLSGKNVPGGADLVFRAGVETDLASDTATLSDLSLDVLGMSIRGDLTASEIQSGAPSARGQLRIKGEDLARLLKVLEIEPAASEIGQLDKRAFTLEVDLEADLSRDTASLSNLHADLLGTVVRGQLAASKVQTETPAIRGQIVAEGQDLLWLARVARLEPAVTELSKMSERAFSVKTDLDVDLETGAVALSNLDAVLPGTVVRGQLAASKVQTETPAIRGQIVAEGKDLLWLARVAGMEAAAKELSNVSDRAFTVKTDLDADLEKGTITLSNLDAKLLDTALKAQLDARRIRTETPAVSGTIDARGPDLARLLAVAGVQPLAGQLAGLKDRSFDFKAKLDTDLEKGYVKVSGLDARLVGATIQGHVDASEVGTKTPVAKGSLSATGPDLPALLQIAGQLGGAGATGLGDLGQKLAGVSGKAFDIKAEFDADLKKGNISVPALSARSLGIAATGRLQAKDMAGKKGSIDGKLAMTGENLAGVLAALGQAPLGEVLQSIAVDAGIKGEGQEFALSPLALKATLAGKQIPNSPVDVTLGADTRANLEKQTLTVNNLALTGLGLNVSGNINATGIKEKPAFSGDLAVAEFNLRRLAGQLNQKLPETADKNALSKVALKTGFSGNPDSLSLQNLSLQLDETKLDGSLSVSQFTQPAIQFAIAIDAINADRYLPPPPEGKAGKPATPETAAAGAATELPLETLRKLNVNGDLQIGQLVLSNARMNNVKLSIRAKDGDIQLDPVAANLYEGQYQGKLTLNAKGKVPQLLVNTQLSGVQLEPLLKDYTRKPESQLAGRANLSAANLNASGSTADQLKKSLAGQAKFQVEEGVLRGIDVRKTLEAAEVLLESKRIGTVKQGGETRFDQLSGTLDISGGVVMNKDLLMTSPGFRVTGEGMLANLHDNSIKYNLQVGVDERTATRGEERYNLGGYKIPIKCRGQLEAIETACLPDLEGLAAVALKKGIKEKLEEQIQDKLGITLPGTKPAQPPPTEQPAAPAQPAPEQQTTQTQEPAPEPAPKQEEKPKDPVQQITDELFKGIGDALKGF